MKNQFIRSLIAVALAAVPGALQAQPDAHYPPGIEGILCATLPPPGFYFRDYNLLYDASQMNDAAGNKVPGSYFHVFQFANVPRAIWITDTKFLGGYVGGDVLTPVQVVEKVKSGSFSTTRAGLMDAFVEGTLSWHPGQFDIGSAVGINIPTGNSGQVADPGNGYWGPQLTLGATWWVDPAKTWAISVLNRYEINSKDRDLTQYDVTAGQAWTMEWGLSKTLKDVCPAIKKMELGVVGYYQQRITFSTGYPCEALETPQFAYSRVAAAGPEINVDFPFCTTSLRYNYEFLADSRAQGQLVTLTLTKKF
jgi:hypothetical protein